MECAIFGRHPEVVEFLLKNGGNTTTFNLHMRSVLFQDDDNAKDVEFLIHDFDGSMQPISAHILILYCRLPSRLFVEFFPHLHPFPSCEAVAARYKDTQPEETEKETEKEKETEAIQDTGIPPIEPIKVEVIISSFLIFCFLSFSYSFYLSFCFSHFHLSLFSPSPSISRFFSFAFLFLGYSSFRFLNFSFPLAVP